MLFSAGCPLGTRESGVDVPHKFEQLDVGPTYVTQIRSPGYFSTDAVREIPTRLDPSAHPYVRPVVSDTSRTSHAHFSTLELGSSISFQLTGGQGAALLTKHRTLSEDAELGQTFEIYTKEHYDSWVAFARNRGHPDGIKPVLVTGVDIDFATMSYSSDGDEGLMAEFKTSTPGVASSWGAWRTTGAVHTNCGSQSCGHPPPPQTADATSSGSSHTQTVSGEYNRCTFIRYYTMRKRLWIPGSNDIILSLFDDDGGRDRSSATSTDAELDAVFHNTTPVRSLSHPSDTFTHSD